MENRSLAYASYWRNSLADTELGRGALSQRDVSVLSRIPPQGLLNGVMPADLVTAWFAEEPAHVKAVEVMIRPRVHVARTVDDFFSRLLGLRRQRRQQADRQEPITTSLA